MQAWDALPVEAQERAMGRTKLSALEFPDEDKAPNSHLALNTILDEDGTQHQIMRFNVPFGEVGKREFGTYFIGYVRTPDVTSRRRPGPPRLRTRTPTMPTRRRPTGPCASAASDGDRLRARRSAEDRRGLRHRPVNPWSPRGAPAMRYGQPPRGPGNQRRRGAAMQRGEESPLDADVSSRRLSRRTVLKGAGAAGLAVGLTGSPAAARGTRALAAPWESFDDAVEKEFARMGLVGAAVAVVSADRVLHTRTLGVRGLHSRRPVTKSTHFLVASTTKSMSSLLVATFVDDGKLGWDQRVIDAWPGFRAPTEQLTETLRVRDLLGMASGIGEPPALSGLHEGDPTATQLLQSIVTLPVINDPGKEFFYNNTVYAVGGYLPALSQGTSGERLAATFADQMHERVYGPVHMSSARIADDPRGLVKDYARGNGLDLSGNMTTLAYGPVGSYAPVGGTLATLDDMAAYVRLQLRGGVSVSGRRVVSSSNLTECWKPHIAVPTAPELDPDAISAGYGLGWSSARYRDGSSLVSHNGGIDGFTSFIGFMPEHDIGLVVLNSVNPGPTGLFFYSYVLNLLLSRRFGLNARVPAKVHNAYEAASSDLRKLGRHSRPVDLHVVAPFLGYYEGGYRLVIHEREPQILIGPRVMPIRAMPDGDYVMSGGLLVGSRVILRRDSDGVPHMELVGLETVRRTVGLG